MLKIAIFSNFHHKVISESGVSPRATTRASSYCTHDDISQVLLRQGLLF